MGLGGQGQAPAVLPPRKRTSTHCIGGWVGTGPVWTGAENVAPPGFDPRTVDPVASRCTNCSIPAPFVLAVIFFRCLL